MSWTMEEMMNLATGYWRSGALIAAVELDLFIALGEDGATAAELAGRLNVSERHLEGLLNALAGLRLLRKDRERFALDPEAAPFLAPHGELCLLDSLRFNADLYALWGRLAETVRTGAPAIPPGAHLGMDAERTARFVRGMHSRAMGMAPQLLPCLPIPSEGRVLDVGSGPGTFSRLMAEQSPGLRVMQMDLPPVLEVARELTAGSPAAGRIDFLPGDYRRDEMGGPFDAALFCGALHQESPTEAVNVLRRIVRAVRPRGRVVVADLMLDEDRPEPAFAALFGLTMMLTSPEGGVHSTRAAAGMLSAAGLESIAVSAPEGLPYRVVAGQKPGKPGAKE